MTIWAISLEGNAATRRQVAVAAKALQDAANMPEEIVFFTPRAPAGAIVLANNTIVTWTAPPPPQELAAVETAEGTRLTAPWPHTIVACRPEVAALALAIKAASGGHTKIVQIQDPNDATGTYAFDRGAFDLIIKQSHEAVTGPNVIVSMPMHDLTADTLTRYREAALEQFPHYRDAPPLVVLLGGSDEHVSLAANDFAAFGSDIAALGQGRDILVLSSRRTSMEQKQAFLTASAGNDRIFFNRPGLGYNYALGLGGGFVVDGTSASMIAEALATGKAVSVYDYRGKLRAHPLWRTGEMHKRIAIFPEFSIVNVTPA